MIKVYEKIGEGSYGSVHRCFVRGFEYAIKFMDMDNMDVLVRDVLILRFLQDKSHNVPTLHGYGILENNGNAQFFLLMELCARLQRYGADELFNVLKQLAEAVETLHSVGLAHRDIVPNNIMIRPNGTLALIDFGLGIFAGDKPCRDLFTTRVTTITSRPPELITTLDQMAYDPLELDIWSTAVSSLCICGYKTYIESPKTETYEATILEPIQQNAQHLGKFSAMLSESKRMAIKDVVHELSFVKTHTLTGRKPVERISQGKTYRIILHNNDHMVRCTKHTMYNLESTFRSYIPGHSKCVFERAKRIAESACTGHCRSTAAGALAVSWGLHCRLSDAMLKVWARWCDETNFQEIICRILVRMRIDKLGHCINGHTP
jgi:serine/threonine protein kinase